MGSWGQIVVPMSLSTSEAHCIYHKYNCTWCTAAIS